MAKPRVFVSSTYYDLRILRADLERFIRDLGYEPVLFEQGHIAYKKDEALEESCYNEVKTCDIIVTIIGSRYGTPSKENKLSITQNEIARAIEDNKQIYIFVEKAVLNEYRTYQQNKDVKDFKPASVDNKKVFEFIEEMYALPTGNSITGFELSHDITSFLKEQFAGLFSRLLQMPNKQKEAALITELTASTSQLKQIVDHMLGAKKDDQFISQILMGTHPAFAAIKDQLQVPYRVVFFTLDELVKLLEARSYNLDPDPAEKDTYEFDHKDQKYFIRIKKSIFDKDGKLLPISASQWKSEYIQKLEFLKSDVSEEIPF